MTNALVFLYYIILYITSIVFLMREYIVDNKILDFAYVLSSLSVFASVITLAINMSKISPFLYFVTGAVYLVVRTLTNKILRSYYKNKASKEFVDNKFPKKVSTFENKVYLLENGILANKFALSSYLKQSEVYKTFVETRVDISNNLMALYEKRKIVGYPIFDWLFTTLDSGEKVVDSLNSKLLFEEDEAVVVDEFSTFVVQLLFLNSILEVSLLKEG